MAGVERSLTIASQRATRILVDVGREVHAARLSRGLSQSTVAKAIGISQTHLSRIERAQTRSVMIGTLARAAAAVGLELSVRLFPAGLPLRDRAHIALLERFRRAAGPDWRWAAEVPLPIPGDRRAWDRVMKGAGVSIGIEAETRPTDMQELGRRVALKKRDGGVDRVILVLADTEWCRRLVRLNDLGEAFPIPAKVAVRALAGGRDPGGDAIVLI